MAPVLIGSFQPGSEPWHAARAKGLGGSEIGAVLGLSPYESRFSLWHRKAGMVDPIEETPPIEWGKRLEQPILAKFREVHPDLDYDVRNGTFSPEGRPWQIANPDLLATDRVIDAKFSLFGDGWGDAGTDDVPPHIRCQVVWYMDVLELDRADLAVLVGGYDYREYTVRYDAAEAKLLRDRGAQFLDDLARARRPNIDDHSETYEVIKEMHPEIVPEKVLVDNDIARAFIATKAAKKRAEAAAQQATSVLADVMGEAHVAEWDGRIIARRQTKGDSRPFVVAAKNLPELEQEDAA